MLQGENLKAWLRKRMHTTGVVPWFRYEKRRPWIIRRKSSSMHEDDEEKNYIPRDVPKGHLAVYVGENQSRFVINVKLLKNHLFSALLDQAQEEYGFTTESRLYIPCHEDIFLGVLRCAKDIRFTSCLSILSGF